MVQSIFRCLRGMSDEQLHFGGSSAEVSNYVDSDFAGELYEWRSLAG